MYKMNTATRLLIVLVLLLGMSLLYLYFGIEEMYYFGYTTNETSILGYFFIICTMLSGLLFILHLRKNGWK